MKSSAVEHNNCYWILCPVFHVLCLALVFYIKPSYAQSVGIKFVDVTDESGLDFRHFTGAFGKRYMPETMGAGCAFLDFDNDGNLDVLLVNGKSWKDRKSDTTATLYRNLGDSTFANVTRAAKLDVPMYGMGIAVADYDNDGDTDIFFANLGKNRLFRNNRNGTFTDVTEWAEVGDEQWSTSAAFFDYNRDGLLDLFVCNYVRWTQKTDVPCIVDDQYLFYCTPTAYPGESCRLYRNRGDSTFEDVTVQAGIYNPKGKSLGVALLDYNNDGWLDLAVANDTEPNFLYRNNGNGSFTDEALLQGIAVSEKGMARGSMGIDATDVYNDGGLALAIGNFSTEMTAFFYASSGDYFSDCARQVRIGGVSLLALTFGLFFFDFDLDAHTDLFCVNGHIEPDINRAQSNVDYAQRPSLFWNRGDGTFDEIGSQVGLDNPGVGRGAAYGDYDNDGDLDLLISNNGVQPDRGQARLLRNDGGNHNNYLRVKAVGKESNRDGIGAKVILKAGRVTQQRLVRTGSSYCSQSETILTFGIGKNKRVESLQVIWPSGKIDRYVDLLGNSLIEVVEGETNQ